MVTFLFSFIPVRYFLSPANATSSEAAFTCQGVYRPRERDEGSFNFNLRLELLQASWRGQWRPGHSLVPYSVIGTMQLQSPERPGGNWLFFSNSNMGLRYISFHSTPAELPQVGPQNLNPGREVLVDIGTATESFVEGNSGVVRELSPEIRALCTRNPQE